MTQLRRFLTSADAANLTDEQKAFLIWRAQERNQRARYETAAWRRTGALILRELAGPQISRIRIAAVRRVARKMLKTVIPARKVDMRMDLQRTLAVANNSRKNTARDEMIRAIWSKSKAKGLSQQRALNAINKKLGATLKLSRFRQIIAASGSSK